MDPSNSLVLIFPSKVDRWILWLMAVPLSLSFVAVISALCFNLPVLPQHPY